MRGPFGHTAFIEACCFNYAEMVALFLARKDLLINRTNDGGERGFLAACCSESIAVVQLLLQRDEVKNLRNHRGDNALMMAKFHGNSELLNILLAHGGIVAKGKNS